MISNVVSSSFKATAKGARRVLIEGFKIVLKHRWSKEKS